MKNISHTHNCYGCGVCSMACGKNIIRMKLNPDGFYEPYITDENLCVNCGLCLDVCAFNKNELASQPQLTMAYGGWSLDENVRRTCSSGGVGFEVAKYLLSEGYKIIAVRYNTDKKRAEHFIASSIDELLESKGSKYIQSYTLDAFDQISRKEKYLFIGTPCQVDSFRHYIRKFRIENNFVLMDFFCHGVPSYWLWAKYMKTIEGKIADISEVHWRSKTHGWYDSWAMKIVGKGYDRNNIVKVERRATEGDLFYKFFLGDLCLGSACYDQCKYKGLKSSADIRLGDLWGSAYQNNAEGVSAVVVLTKKGQNIIEKCSITKERHAPEVVMEGQMKKCPNRPDIFPYVQSSLKDENISLEDIAPKVINFLKYERIKRMLKNPIALIKKIYKRYI